MFVPRQEDVARLVARMGGAFASNELKGSGVVLKLRRWADAFGEEPLACIVEGHLGRREAQGAPRQSGGGWLEYATRFPDDFQDAGVVAGSHGVTWRTLSEDELAADEFRFP
jgi:hypothetical protein